MVPHAIHVALREGRRPDYPKTPLTLAFELQDVKEPMLWTPRAPKEAVVEAWWPRTWDRLRAYDSALLLAQHAHRLGVDAGVYDRKRERYRTVLAKVLRVGLQRRLGGFLSRREEQVLIHLAPRVLAGDPGDYAGALRVCEWCLRVFEAPRAKRCDDCRDKGRWTPQERHETTVFFHGFARAQDDRPRELQFVGQCEQPHCTARFQSSNVRTRYCAEHATPAAYTARARAAARA